MLKLAILKPLIIVPNPHPVKSAQTVKVVQALERTKVAEEAKVGLDQGVVLHEPDLTPCLMLAPHVLLVALPHINVDCL